MDLVTIDYQLIIFDLDLRIDKTKLEKKKLFD